MPRQYAVSTPVSTPGRCRCRATRSARRSRRPTCWRTRTSCYSSARYSGHSRVLGGTHGYSADVLAGGDGRHKGTHDRRNRVAVDSRRCNKIRVRTLPRIGQRVTLRSRFVCLFASVYLFVCFGVFVCLLRVGCLFCCLVGWLFVSLRFVCLCVYVFVCLCVCLFLFVFVCLCLFACCFVLFVCLFVCCFVLFVKVVCL